MVISDSIATDVVVSPAKQPRGSGPWQWIARRFALGALVVFAASVLIFLAIYALPGDPARSILGKDATPEAIAQLRAALGLDRSLVVQYVDWWKSMLAGDFGDSLVTQRPVWQTLGPALSNSVQLLALTAIVAIPLSVFLGTWTAVRRDRAVDRATLVGSVVLAAMPEFVVGMLLVALLSTNVFHLLPAVVVIPEGSSPLAHPLEVILPVLTLVLAVAPYLYRLVRGSMIDVLESEYVVMARLKGLSTRTIVVKHALPNALVPVTQASAVILGYLLGGIVVVEFVFGFPGIGTLLTGAVTQRDVPSILAASIMLTSGVVVFNLIADVITVVLTPKLRTAGGRS